MSDVVVAKVHVVEEARELWVDCDFCSVVLCVCCYVLRW